MYSNEVKRTGLKSWQKGFGILTIAFILLGIGISAAHATLAFYPTGVDDANNLLPGGSKDPHYNLITDNTASPAVVMSSGNLWSEWQQPTDAQWLYNSDNGVITSAGFDSGIRGWVSYETTALSI